MKVRNDKKTNNRWAKMSLSILWFFLGKYVP